MFLVHPDGSDATDPNDPNAAPHVMIKWSSTNDTVFVPESTVRFENDGATRRRRPVKTIYKPDSPKKSKREKREKKETAKRKKEKAPKHKPPQLKKSRKRGVPPPLRVASPKSSQMSSSLTSSSPAPATPTFATLAAATAFEEIPPIAPLPPVAEEQEAPLLEAPTFFSKNGAETSFEQSFDDIISIDEEGWKESSDKTPPTGKTRQPATSTIPVAAVAASTNAEPHLESEDSGEERHWQDPDAAKKGTDGEKEQQSTGPGESSTTSSPSHSAFKTPLSSPAPTPASPFHPKLTMENYDLRDRDTFPGQVFQLLQDSTELGIDHVLSWEDDGKTFRLRNEKKFLKILLCLSNNRKVISFRNTLSQFGFQCVEYGENGRAFRHVSAIPTDPQNSGSMLFHKDATKEQVQKIQRRAPSSNRKQKMPPSGSSNISPSQPLSVDAKTLKRLSFRSSPPKKADLEVGGLVKKRKLTHADIEVATTSMPRSGQKRSRTDVWVMPSEGSTHLLDDGTWATPVGEPRDDGLKWDSIRGMWGRRTSREDEKEKEDAHSSDDSSRTKGLDHQSRLPWKKKKHLVVYSSDGDEEDNSDGGDDESGNKAEESKRKMNRIEERESRRTSDGCLIPRTKPLQNEDGTYAKPGGGAPRNLQWDPVRGLWAPSKSSNSRTQPQRVNPAPDPAVTGRRTLPPRASRDAAVAAITKPTEQRQAARPVRRERDPLDGPPTRVQYYSSPREEPSVVCIETSGKHDVLHSASVFPTFLMFKKRHVYRGKFKARTKANPTGIIGGDNEFMKDVNTDNWSRLYRMMHERRDAAGNHHNDMDVDEENTENLSYNTNGSFSSAESTQVAHPPSLETDGVEYAIPKVLPPSTSAGVAAPLSQESLNI
ncbi:MAG: hypothetical protein SGILL_005098 [Bacillariaceae sp.]